MKMTLLNEKMMNLTWPNEYKTEFIAEASTIEY